MEMFKDLNVSSVKALDKEELKQINGGLAPVTWFLMGIAVSELLDRDNVRDFMEGFNDARNR